MKYETTTYTFKAINPAKKYDQFTYQDLNWNQVNSGDCYKGTILKIDEVYYLYSGEVNSHLSEPIPSKILFKIGRNVVREVLA